MGEAFPPGLQMLFLWFSLTDLPWSLPLPRSPGSFSETDTHADAPFFQVGKFPEPRLPCNLFYY